MTNNFIMIKVTTDFCELIGVIIGDGNIYYRKNYKYVLMITGNPKTDNEFFQHLSDIIFRICGRRPKIKIRCGGLRLTFQSKNLIKFMIDELGFPYGEGKCYKIFIPNKLQSLEWNSLKCIIRGIADTDGSIFTFDKPGSPNYPSIEITTTSKKLAYQLDEILKNKGFRSKLRYYVDKRYNTTTFKIALNGWDMLNKWLNEIGFSHPIKFKKAVDIIDNRLGQKLGQYHLNDAVCSARESN